MIRRRVITLVTLASALALASCSDDPAGPGTVVTGVWGGEHVELVADADGTRLEYDCAHSVIDGDPVLGEDRTLDWVGTLWFEGGPVDPSMPPAPIPARYEGRVMGDVMILHVTLTDRDQVLGPYFLTRGRYGLLRKCL